MTLARRSAAILAALAAAWWLFSDTYARYANPAVSSENTIRFAHFGGYLDYELWQRIIDEFEAHNAGVTVGHEYVPGWYGRYDAKIRQQILAGDLPDVVVMQPVSFRALSEHFQPILPMTDASDSSFIFKGEIHPTALKAFTVASADSPADRLRGVPFAGGDLLIYWNPECFDKADAYHGRPIPRPNETWTMQQFAEIGRGLTIDFDGDGRLDQFGFWLPRWIYYLPFMWSFGAEITNDANDAWTLQGPAAESAFSFYREIARDHRICPTPDEVPELIQDVGFLTGKVALCVNGPWFEPFLAETRLRDVYCVEHVPCGPAGRATRITWDGLCISAGLSGKRRQLAWRFVRFCLSESVQRMIAETGRAIPALRDAVAAFDRDGRDPRRRKFTKAMAYSRLQPNWPEFNFIDQAVNRRLQRLIDPDDPLDPGEFLDALRGDPAVRAAFDDGRR